MSTFLCRPSEPADAAKLAVLRWNLRTDDDPTCDAAAKDAFIRQFVAWIETAPDKDLLHWVAERDGELVGVISVRIIHKMPSPEEADGRFGYLTNSYALPGHRNAGVGTALLAAVKDWAISEGLELLVVWPSERAYPLYERAGHRRHPDPVVLKLR